MELALRQIGAGTLRIDENGRIWRTRRDKKGLPRPVRAEFVGHKGYLRIILGVPGSNSTCSVQAHRLVWVVANGPIPDGLQINHKDLDKQNNCLGNLEVVTASENIQHSYANGRPHPWHKATEWRGKKRLTPEDAEAIRTMRAGGALLREIAARFGISVSYAQRVANRKEV